MNINFWAYAFKKTSLQDLKLCTFMFLSVFFFRISSGQNWSRFCAGKLQQKLYLNCTYSIYFDWLYKTEWNIVYNVTFLKNDGAAYAFGLVIEIY